MGIIMGNVRLPPFKISTLALKLRELLIFLTLKTHIPLTVSKDTSCLLKIEKIKKMLEKVIFLHDFIYLYINFNIYVLKTSIKSKNQVLKI